MIEIQHITKRYGNKVVLKDVSTTIPKGGIVSLIGPNGAGKSTLLSIISRLLSSEEGTVKIEGKYLSDWESNELAKRLSVLKQTNHLTLRLTVRELVSFGRFPYTKGQLNQEDESKIDEALTYMELMELQHYYLDELSGGQRQRAFIAMVLAQDTDYILLDEPLNNLDMKHAVQIMKVLRKMADDLQKTIVIVIHDINFASCYSDYIIAMKDGEIAKEGRTNDIIQQSVLEKLYGMDVHIECIKDCQICVYF